MSNGRLNLIELQNDIQSLLLCLFLFLNHFQIRKSVKQKQPPEILFKKGVLRNFAKFTGKHLCQSLFFNKIAGLRPILKKLSRDLEA